MPTGACLAIARRIGTGMVWSPPIAMGAMPAACTSAKNASIISIERSRLSGLTGASPRSATLHTSNGAMPLVGCDFRISRDASRTPAGPWRAPARKLTPMSNGTPIRPMSTSAEISWRRVRMNVATSAKRGTTVASTC